MVLIMNPLNPFAGKSCLLRTFSVLLLLGGIGSARGEEEEVSRSQHIGVLYPNGVDIVGYTVEHRSGDHLYSYYTFGFPALAAVGISYYQAHDSQGWTASAGTGIGFLNQVNFSVAYQWPMTSGKTPAFLKLGAGRFGSLVGKGAFPVLSLEWRMK